jgi:hypothetical protein
MSVPLSFQRLWSFVRWPPMLASIAGRGIYRIRFRVAKLIYDGICFVVVRAWQEPLRASLAPRSNDRILDFGSGVARPP